MCSIGDAALFRGDVVHWNPPARAEGESDQSRITLRITLAMSPGPSSEYPTSQGITAGEQWQLWRRLVDTPILLKGICKWLVANRSLGLDSATSAAVSIAAEIVAKFKL
jgi:hypothetical protein